MMPKSVKDNICKENNDGVVFRYGKIFKSSILVLSAIMTIFPKVVFAKDYYIAIQSIKPVKKTQAEVCDDKLAECNIYLALSDKNIIHARATFSDGGVEFRFVLDETEKLSADQQDYFYFPLGNEGTFERDVSLFVPPPDTDHRLLVERISNLKVADLKIFIKTSNKKPPQ